MLVKKAIPEIKKMSPIPHILVVSFSFKVTERPQFPYTKSSANQDWAPIQNFSHVRAYIGFMSVF